MGRKDTKIASFFKEILETIQDFVAKVFDFSAIMSTDSIEFVESWKELEKTINNF